MRASRRQHLIVVGAGALALNAGAAPPGQGAEPGAAARTGSTADPAQEIAQLKEEIERLKGLLPDQAHVMKTSARFLTGWTAPC